MPADVELGIDLKKTGKGDEEAALGLKVVAKEADNLKDQLGQLDRKLAETNVAMLASAKAFAAGTASYKEFSKTTRDIRQIENVAKALKKAAEDSATPAAKGFLAKFGDTVSGGLPKIGGISSGMSSALVYGAVAAAPAIGATINSAVLLGLGGGTLAAGIVLAAHDSRVRSAWAEFAQSAKTDLTGAADVFVAPLERSAQTFQKTLHGNVIPLLRQDFAALAPTVDNLSEGLSKFVTNAGPGLSRAIQSSVPVINAAADGMARLGSALGYAGSQFAFGSTGAKDMTQDLVTLTDGAIRGTATIVGFLSKIYELSHIPGLGGLVQDISAIDEKTKGVHKSFQLLKPPVDDAATSIDNLKQKMRDFTAEALGMQDAELGLKSGLLQIAEAFKASNGSMDTGNRLGLQAREALQGQIDKIGEHRKQLLGQHQSIARVNDIIGAELKATYDDAAAHGANRKSLDELFAAWKSILNLPGDKTLTTIVRTVYETVGSPTGGRPTGGTVNNIRYFERSGGVVAAAQGMIAKSPTVLFGERGTGAEAYIPKLGISDVRGLALADTAARWHGGRVVPAGGRGGGTVINLTVNAGMGADGQQIGREIVKVLNQQLRTDPAAATTIKAALA